MIQEKWDELNKKYNELLDYILKDIDGMEFYDAYKVQIAQDQIEDIIAMHNGFKPFEVEVGKEYVAKFDMYVSSYITDKGNVINKKEKVYVFEIGGDTICFDYGVFAYAMLNEQFKACFSPKEDDYEI